MMTSAEVKAVVKETGADLVGIASVDRFSEAPPMRRPEDLLPGTRSVIVAAIRYPLDGVRRIGEPPAYALPSIDYDGAMCRKLEDISLHVMRWLEDRRASALSAPVTWPIGWRVRPYKDMEQPLQAMFSHQPLHPFVKLRTGFVMPVPNCSISPISRNRRHRVSFRVTCEPSNSLSGISALPGLITSSRSSNTLTWMPLLWS